MRSGRRRQPAPVTFMSGLWPSHAEASAKADWTTSNIARYSGTSRLVGAERGICPGARSCVTVMTNPGARLRLSGAKGSGVKHRVQVDSPGSPHMLATPAGYTLLHVMQGTDHHR